MDTIHVGNLFGLVPPFRIGERRLLKDPQTGQEHLYRVANWQRWGGAYVVIAEKVKPKS